MVESGTQFMEHPVAKRKDEFAPKPKVLVFG